MLKEILISLMVVVLVLSLALFGAYKVNKGSCYERAELYETSVKGYSFWKNYCFIEKDGKAIELEQYIEAFIN